MVQAVIPRPPVYDQIKATFSVGEGWTFHAKNNRMVVMLNNRRGTNVTMQIVDFENGVFKIKNIGHTVLATVNSADGLMGYLNRMHQENW